MKKIFWVISALIVLIVSACGVSGSPNTEISTEPMPAEYVGLTNPLGEDAAEKGAITFKTTCASCHGEEGRGDGPASSALNPMPKNLAVLQQEVGDDYLYWKISDGSLGTAMVSWKGILTEEQIWELVAFIRTLK